MTRPYDAAAPHLATYTRLASPHSHLSFILPSFSIPLRCSENMPAKTFFGGLKAMDAFGKV